MPYDGINYSNRPAKGSSEMSERTKVLRPSIPLSEQEIEQIRTLRRQGFSVDEVAEQRNQPVQLVREAMLNMREPPLQRKRATLNVGVAIGDYVYAQRQYLREPIWRVMARMVEEHEGGQRMLRAAVRRAEQAEQMLRAVVERLERAERMLRVVGLTP